MDLKSTLNNVKNSVASKVQLIDVDSTVQKAQKSIVKAKDTVVLKAQNIDIDVTDVLRHAVKVPGVKIDRDIYLRKELKNLYSEDVVDDAVKNNPAKAGITKDAIDKIATSAINYETAKVSAISFAAGLPGGIAMVGTITADIIQYFGFLLRILQKLAYLYGFEDFELQEDSIDDDTLNKLLIMLGVMFGVQEANTVVKKIAATAASKISKSLAQKALTKGTIYPIVKKIALQIGFKMNKQIFAESISKAVPVVGGVVSGGLSFATFKPCANKLRNTFRDLPLCDPETYKD